MPPHRKPTRHPGDRVRLSAAWAFFPTERPNPHRRQAGKPDLRKHEKPRTLASRGFSVPVRASTPEFPICRAMSPILVVSDKPRILNRNPADELDIKSGKIPDFLKIVAGVLRRANSRVAIRVRMPKGCLITHCEAPFCIFRAADIRRPAVRRAGPADGRGPDRQWPPFWFRPSPVTGTWRPPATSRSDSRPPRRNGSPGAAHAPDATATPPAPR